MDLKERPQFVPVLAQWHHAEWAHLNPGQTLESRLQKMQLFLGDALIPSMFCQEENNGVLGSAALVECDMDSHRELTPWLASVYVRADRRGEGIGSTLVQQVMTMAAQHGINELYLFTPDRAAFYQRLGWQIVAHEHYHNEAVTLMKVNLSA